MIRLTACWSQRSQPQLKNRIKAEGAGCLNWALGGLRRLKERGHFELPEVVREATEGFRDANDVVGAFVREACLVSDDPEDFEVQAQRLFQAYRHWCRENGHMSLSSTTLAPEWRRLGFGQKERGGRKFYTGVKVDEQWIGAQGEDYPRRWSGW
jgi:putative DNA primase/helicase